MVRATAQREVDQKYPVQVEHPEEIGVEIPSWDIEVEKNIQVHDGYKRIFDITMVVAAHILLFPIALAFWTLIPLAIWLEDRGPIFYTQRRVGRNGRIFRLYKFRSMVADAESMTGPVWASEVDSRITRVGRILRSRALDELPQVINILKGEMSLVGPRPERPEFLDEFMEESPRFLRRLQIAPGLTGLAQVYGRYSSRPRDKLLYDLLYMRRMSVWLDMKMLFLSVAVSLLARWQHNEKKFGQRRKHNSESQSQDVDSQVTTARF